MLLQSRLCPLLKIFFLPLLKTATIPTLPLVALRFNSYLCTLIHSKDIILDILLNYFAVIHIERLKPKLRCWTLNESIFQWATCMRLTNNPSFRQTWCDQLLNRINFAKPWLRSLPALEALLRSKVLAMETWAPERGWKLNKNLAKKKRGFHLFFSTFYCILFFLKERKSFGESLPCLVDGRSARLFSLALWSLRLWLLGSRCHRCRKHRGRRPWKETSFKTFKAFNSSRNLLEI